MIGSTTLLFATIFFALLVTLPASEWDSTRQVFEFMTYAFVAIGLMALLAFAMTARGRVSHGEMEGFDVYLSLRDGALWSLLSGVLANLIGGVIYLVFSLNPVSDFELLVYFFLGFGSFFILAMAIAAIAFEASAIRSARNLGVTA